MAYVARDAPEAAERLGAALIRAAKSLSEFAERGRIVPELGDPAVREMLLGSYRVVYEIFEGHVGVARIIHAKRDFLATWHH